MKLFDQNISRDDLRRRGGRLEQFMGCTRFELQEGPERGVEIIEVKTGSGFRFWVCPSRGLDIVFAEHNGRPLCWNSSTGIAHPHTFSESKFGWLRGFAGGLLTTCGLQSFGPPCEDDGEYFGIHDRISFTPATEVSARSLWRDESTLEIEVCGTLRQTRVFGPNLKLERTIRAVGGQSTLTVHDRITNDGFRPEGAVILYHCNFGYPVVSEDSVVRLPSKTCTPRDEIAARGAEHWNRLEAPQSDFAEQCFFHEIEADERGKVRAEIWNENLGFGGFVGYDKAALPHFTQWKMTGEGTYVCGLEPSNAPLMPRSELKARNELPILEPGETREFWIELGVVDHSNKSS